MKTWIERAKALMTEKGFTQDTLAKKMGVTRGQVGHYLSGRRAPPIKKLEKMAISLGVSLEQLQFGIAIPSSPSETSDAYRIAADIKKIPIIDWQDIEQWIKMPDQCPTRGEMLLEMDNSTKLGEHMFVLKVKGDAMVSPHAAKDSLYEGDSIVISQGIQPAPNDTVLAQINKSYKLRKYIHDGNEEILKALNPAHPIIPITDAVFIVGIVKKIIREV